MVLRARAPSLPPSPSSLSEHLFTLNVCHKAPLLGFQKQALVKKTQSEDSPVQPVLLLGARMGHSAGQPILLAAQTGTVWFTLSLSEKGGQ